MSTTLVGRSIGINLPPPYPEGLHTAKVLGLKDKHLLLSLPEREGKGLWLQPSTKLYLTSPNDGPANEENGVTGAVVGRSTKPIPLLIVALDKDLPISLLGSVGSLVLAVASGKGGTGKTTLSTAFALALAKSGRRTALLDADLGGGNVGIYLGLTANKGLEKVLRGEETLPQILQPGPFNLSVATGLEASPESASPSSWQLDKFRRGLEELAKTYECLVLDLSAGFTPVVSSLLLSANSLLLVANEDPASILDAYGLLKLATTHGHAPKVNLLMNRIEAPDLAMDRATSLQEAASRFLHLRVNLLGLVSADPMVCEATRKGVNPLLYRPEHPFSRQMAKYAETLADRPHPAEQNNSTRKGIG